MSLENKSLVQDFDTQVSKALPAGAATIYTDGIDLGHTANGRVPPGTELIVNAPALVVGDLGNGATMTYVVQMDSDSAFGSPTSIYGTVLTQTGADGTGAAAATKRVALPSDCERYIRVAATNSAAGDASDKTLEVTLLAGSTPPRSPRAVRLAAGRPGHAAT
jgi:hypothetical protein